MDSRERTPLIPMYILSAGPPLTSQAAAIATLTLLPPSGPHEGLTRPRDNQNRFKDNPGRPKPNEDAPKLPEAGSRARDDPKTSTGGLKLVPRLLFGRAQEAQGNHHAPDAQHYVFVGNQASMV